jgi:hypothetical protein
VAQASLARGGASKACAEAHSFAQALASPRGFELRSRWPARSSGSPGSERDDPSLSTDSLIVTRMAVSFEIEVVDGGFDGAVELFDHDMRHHQGNPAQIGRIPSSGARTLAANTSPS